MSKPTDPTSRVTRSGAVAFCVAIAAGALWWSGTLAAPESMLAQGFRTAIADAEAPSAAITLTPAALSDGGEKPVAAIWPDPSAKQGLGFYRPLKVGDRITIASREGKADKLSVVELQQIDGAGIGAPGVQFQLVTSRQEGAPNAPLVRFLIAVEGSTAPTTSAPKAL